MPTGNNSIAPDYRSTSAQFNASLHRPAYAPQIVHRRQQIKKIRSRFIISHKFWHYCNIAFSKITSMPLLHLIFSANLPQLCFFRYSGSMLLLIVRKQQIKCVVSKRTHTFYSHPLSDQSCALIRSYSSIVIGRIIPCLNPYGKENSASDRSKCPSARQSARNGT